MNNQTLEKITPEYVNNLEDSEVKELATYNSPVVIAKIHELSQKIEQTKEAANNAKNMKIGGFLRRGKQRDAKTDAIARAVATNSELIGEMNDLIQSTVRLVCVSTKLSQFIAEKFSDMMINGFKKTSGEVIRLNKAGKDYVKALLSEIDRNISAEQEQERRMTALQEYSDKKDNELKEDIQHHDERIRTLGERSDVKDKEHDERISTVSERSDAKDEEHDERIRTQGERSDAKDKEHDERIDALYKIVKSDNSIWKIISAVSLIISIIAIILAVL